MEMEKAIDLILSGVSDIIDYHTDVSNFVGYTRYKIMKKAIGLYLDDMEEEHNIKIFGQLTESDEVWLKLTFEPAITEQEKNLQKSLGTYKKIVKYVYVYS